MRQLNIVSLSSKGTFIVQDKEGNFHDYPIEGFTVSTLPQHRPCFSKFITTTIDCTLNRAATHIRYLNEEFLTEKVREGAMSVVPKEIEESKIYSAEQKGRLLKCEKENTEEPTKVVDLVANRKELNKWLGRGGEVKARLEYFSDEIVVSLLKDGCLLFVPVRLRNINILFPCLPESTFGQFFLDNPSLVLQLERPIYNLAHRRFEVMARLSAATELHILSQGWAVVNSAALAQTDPAYNANDYLKAEAEAKQKHIGVFSRNTQILGFIYAKNNFVGEVSDIFDGYIFEVVRRTTGERVKIELAMVRCPVGDEVGAFNCREFARKHLIGEEVNVYLHKDSGLNITGSIVRARDSKDVQSMMVESGWGFIREEFHGSILCLKLVELEKKAKEKLRGLHSKEVGVYRPEDLTVANTQKEEIYVYRRTEILKSLAENETGVLQGFYDALYFKVWLSDKNILMRVRLEGVQGHNINPLLEEIKQMKDTTKNIYDKSLKKRSVVVSIKDYLKDVNAFLGTITLAKGRALQQIVLEEGLVYTDREHGTKPEYKPIEEAAKKKEIGLWSANLRNFEPVNPLDRLEKRFKGKFSWVEDGETVFIQPSQNAKNLDTIYSQLQSKQLKKAGKDLSVVGSLVAAPYEGDLYRARILSFKGKRVRVMFVDWGNREFVEEANLYELPEALKFIEAQCLRVKLFLTRPIRNPQYLERLRGELMNEEEFQFKREEGDFVSTYRDKVRPHQRGRDKGGRRDQGENRGGKRKFTAKQGGDLGVDRRGGAPGPQPKP